VEGRGGEGAGAGGVVNGDTSVGIPQVATRRECSLCRDTDTHANRTQVIKVQCYNTYIILVHNSTDTERTIEIEWH
jgi:hypothetical protein